MEGECELFVGNQLGLYRGHEKGDSSWRPVAETVLTLEKVYMAQANGDQDSERDSDSGIAVAPEKPQLARPPMYKVIIMNDDYTPMEFVVHVLESFFAMNREKATQIMLTIHTSGSAVAGIFTKDIAESKSAQVNQYAQENQHPLMSTVEMTD